MDIDQAPIDTFIADLEADNAPRHVSDQGRGPLAKKLMFSSQETPEEQCRRGETTYAIGWLKWGPN
jgi:hypothetical protein